MPAASSMRAALVLTEAISFIVGAGREPEGRKTVAHGAQPWVADGPRLPAPERGVRRAAARVLPPHPGAKAGPSFSQCLRTGLLSCALRAGPHENRRCARRSQPASCANRSE